MMRYLKLDHHYLKLEHYYHKQNHHYVKLDHHYYENSNIIIKDIVINHFGIEIICRLESLMNVTNHSLVSNSTLNTN